MPSSSKNLAQYFASAKIVQPKDCLDPANFPTTSQAVDAEDDNHFESTSFKLKRTRSMGLLDEFIAPTRALLEEQEAAKQQQLQQTQSSSSTTSLDNFIDNDDDENQFIENVEDLPAQSKPKHKNIIYNYDDEGENEKYNDSEAMTNDNRNARSNEPYSDENEDTINSPSSPGSPDLYQPHDDNDISYEPSSHVDYLSHDWKESDISKSWRYIVLRRKDVANSARLENASWRTWAQAKYHLKTVSPESVNWLKDSDVTWLYGPLYAEPQQHDLYGSGSHDDISYNYHTEASTKACLRLAVDGSKEPAGPKPILKKRTVGEMLSQPSMIKLPPHHHSQNQQQQQQQYSPPVFEEDFNEIQRKVNAQYQTNNSSNTVNDTQNAPASPLISSTTTNQPSSSLISPPLNSQTNPSNTVETSAPAEPVKRHIHFNDRVEQCIALNYPDTEDEYEGEEEYESDNGYREQDYNSDEDSDEEGGFFLSVRSQSSSHLPTSFQVNTPLNSTATASSGFKSASTSNITMVKGKAVLVKTIELLPATTLNYGSDQESEQEYFSMNSQSTLSHNTNTLRGYNYYHYDYNSVFTAEDNHIPSSCNDDYQDFEIIQDNDILVDGDAQDAVMDVPEGIALGSNIGTTITTSPAATTSAPQQLPELSTSPDEVPIPTHLQENLSGTKLFKSGSSQANLNEQIWGGNITKGSSSNLQKQSQATLLDQWSAATETNKASQSNVAGFGGAGSQSNLSAQFKSLSSSASSKPQDDLVIRHDNLPPVAAPTPKRSGFQFNQDSDEDSSDDEDPTPKPFNTNITHPHLQIPASSPITYKPPTSPTTGASGTINRITSASSSASLSDFAAKGFISRGNDDELNDLQQSFINLNNSSSSFSVGSPDDDSEHSAPSLKSKLLNSWSRNTK